MTPPKPLARTGRFRMIAYLRAFRHDILSAQPARLYRAWMAEFRTPFFRSYLCNDPALIRRILQDQPTDFPKSSRVAEGLRPLLGRSVFVTNGAEWQRQRRIIDPAFEGGRIRDTFPAMLAAAINARDRLLAQTGRIVEIEAETSHAAADVIFRSLFSVPIGDRVAQATYAAFRRFQRAQPLLNLAAFVGWPRWLARPHRRAARDSATEIRTLIGALTAARADLILAGRAPDDIATRIMSTADPVTGQRFTTAEMADQVAIFFLAGHETSASALAWALWLVAASPKAQDRIAAEGATLGDRPDFAALAGLKFTRDVFRETLRLYPPVPMMVREAAGPATFRGRAVRRGSQVVISPWHLHRHERFWDRPDDFDPDRWQSDQGRASAQVAFLPFSAGPRVCPGAGFAMIEGPLLLAMILARVRVAAVPAREPVPVAHLTVRARDGIWLEINARSD